MVRWDEKYRKQDLVILQLYSTCFDAPEKLRAHVAKVGMKYAIGHDPGGAVHQKYMKQPNFPVAYLIGVDGKGVWEGHPTVKKERVAEMEKLIEEELAKIRK